MAIRDAGENVDLKVIVFNKPTTKLKFKVLHFPYYAWSRPLGILR